MNEAYRLANRVQSSAYGRNSLTQSQADTGLGSLLYSKLTTKRARGKQMEETSDECTVTRHDQG